MKLPAQPQYIGLDNYRSLLDDGLFRTSLENTIFFVLVNAPLAIIIPLLLAVLIDGPMVDRTLPERLTSSDDVGDHGQLALGWFLEPVYGVINHYLEISGLPSTG